jgi:hypothetical protein
MFSTLFHFFQSSLSPGESLYGESVIVLIAPTNNTEPDIIKEYESLEQQALKLRFEQELVNMYVRINKQ